MTDHPSSSVCLAGAASPVAEETDVGEADSTTKVASVWSLVGWSCCAPFYI